LFLHLGSNYMIHKDKIVAIFDLETAGNSQTTKKIISNLEKKGSIKNIAEKGKEKSFIISDMGYFLSPISSSTLLKRSMSHTVL